MSNTDQVQDGKPAMEREETSGSQGGFSGFMDDLKGKFSETKLHDAKVALIHKKYVLPPHGTRAPATQGGERS
jgi:hypothetical protein